MPSVKELNLVEKLDSLIAEYEALALKEPSRELNKVLADLKNARVNARQILGLGA